MEKGGAGRKAKLNGEALAGLCRQASRALCLQFHSLQTCVCPLAFMTTAPQISAEPLMCRHAMQISLLSPACCPSLSPLQGGALIKMVPERAGHSIELQASGRVDFVLCPSNFGHWPLAQSPALRP